MENQNFKFIKPGEIRTRIAPSPTGFFHIGVSRTALFNYLFAKKHQGVFILRIEDTDVERCKPEYEKDIMENLKWLGIEWDEGPDIGGQYGPYRQSQREEIYQRYLEKLLNTEKAYYCFCSEEELEAQKQYLMSIGEPPRYSGKCAQLSKKEIKKYLAEGKKSVIRFRVPAKKVEFDDLIREKIEFDANLIGDIVIARDLSIPLYNFACVVDDFEMRVSHVIRGEEHISNTPKQILIQEALNLPRPKYAHLPLILGPDRSKLSKRHGAVSMNQYRKTGYLPETLINLMAFLGWNPGGEREIYSLASLVREFSIERCQKGGAVFNIKRLDFLNGFYIRQKSIDKLTELCLPYLITSGLIEAKSNPEILKLPLEEKAQFKIRESGEEISLETLKKIVSIYQERLKKLSEISQLTDFFFKEKLEYDKDLLRWREITDKEIKHSLDKLRKVLSKIRADEFNKENLEKILLPEAEKLAKEMKKPIGPPAARLPARQGEAGDRGYLLWPLRVALTGKQASAGPFEIAEILGKEKVLKRIKKAKELIK
ncbi:glutamate--tRNA ligase [Patescibacteria group bacterium]|nr:glutamate--tRNA ligase [Patescibacteria group bacterium]